MHDRHPAKWHLSAAEHPSAVWGTTPAWRGADGLPPPGDSSKQPPCAPAAEQAAGQQGAGSLNRPWWPQLPGWVRPEAAAAQSHPAAPDPGLLLTRARPRLRPLPGIGERCYAPAAAAADGDACIAFDVFADSKLKREFSRRAPGLPAFRIVTARQGGRGYGAEGFPSLQCLLPFAAASSPVPLRFAVLEGAEPCFFDVQSGAVLNLLGGAT
jgi:hypothetical protein